MHQYDIVVRFKKKKTSDVVNFIAISIMKNNDIVDRLYKFDPALPSYSKMDEQNHEDSYKTEFVRKTRIHFLLFFHNCK